MIGNPADNTRLQQVNEEIYKRNAELVAVNKTLSLLRQLYQISLQSLDTGHLADQVVSAVREGLNHEAVALFVIGDENTTHLRGFSASERISRELVGFEIGSGIEISDQEKRILTRCISSRNLEQLSSLVDIFGGLMTDGQTQVISRVGHIKTVLTYPLISAKGAIGVLAIAMNRGYEELSEFDRHALADLPAVIALALDKSLLYSELQEANDKLKALDKARAEFVTIASHQLRTPPSTIKWYMAAVLAGDFGPLSQELRAALERVMVSNDAQIAIIDDLLNVSRIERGKLEFFFEKLGLEPIVRAVFQQMQPMAEMKKLQLVYLAPSEELPTVTIDKEKIKQVLINIVDNAIKYSDKGVIKIGLNQKGNDLVVKVTDTGKGISKAELHSIFNKYTRGSESVTHANGLGLGMYVAKVVMEQHHGLVWAESDGVGKGSVFQVSIPIGAQPTTSVVDLTKN